MSMSILKQKLMEITTYLDEYNSKPFLILLNVQNLNFTYLLIQVTSASRFGSSALASCAP